MTARSKRMTPNYNVPSNTTAANSSTDMTTTIDKNSDFVKFYLKDIPSELSNADQSALLQICLRHGSITCFHYRKEENVIDIGFVDSNSAKGCFKEFQNICPDLSFKKCFPVLYLPESNSSDKSHILTLEENSTKISKFDDCEEAETNQDPQSMNKTREINGIICSETDMFRQNNQKQDQIEIRNCDDIKKELSDKENKKALDNGVEQDKVEDDEIEETLFNQNTSSGNAKILNNYGIDARSISNQKNAHNPSLFKSEHDDHEYEMDLKREEQNLEKSAHKESNSLEGLSNIPMTNKFEHAHDYGQDRFDHNYGNYNDVSSKMNQFKSPSSKACVIHIRNLPNSYNKNDLCRVMISYGKIQHCVFMKSQAFLEYRNPSDAANLVEFTRKYPLFFQNQKIILQFSIHHHLEKNEAHHNNNMKTEQLLHGLWSEISHEDKSFLGCSVIEAFVDNMTLPINQNTLLEIYSKYGRVIKIKIFKQNSSRHFKAFIQMDSPYSARIAAHATNKQNIYSNANFLMVHLMKIKELVLNNTPGVECYDYSEMEETFIDRRSDNRRPSLLNDYQDQQHPNPNSQNYQGHSYTTDNDPQPYYTHHRSSSASYRNETSNIFSNNFQDNNSPSQYGFDGPQPFNSNHLDSHQSTSSGLREKSFDNSRHSSQKSCQGRVVLVSNLENSREKLKERVDKIFTLFSTVGHVNKVKILFKSPDKAFIEFNTENQANNAVSMMNLAYLDGRRCSVALSKVANITMKPQDNQDYFRDYRNSRRHRFVGKGLRHLQNIFPPSPKLHLSNMPRDMTEYDIRQLFGNDVSGIKNINLLSDRHMAFVEMANVSLAVDYLIKLHDTRLHDMTLKVSFAKP